MLDLMRRKAQSPYLQATVLIIILVFIFWGVGGQQGNAPNTVATVNDVPISLQEYDRLYNQTLDRYRQQFGGSIPEGLLESLNLKEQVLNQLIERILVRQEAERLGIAVSDAEVRKEISKISSFQVNGVFDLDTYHQILAASRLTVEDFEAGVRADLLSRKVLDYLERFGRVPEHDLAARFAYDNEKIRVRYARFSAEEYKDQVTVTDEDLAAYFDEHKEAYKTSEQRNVKYLAFTTAGSLDGVTLTDDEIRAEYQRTLSRYTEPEIRRARHILFKVAADASAEEREAKRKKAEEVLAMARDKGTDFAGLATIYSEDSTAANGGDLGFFGRGRMVKPFEDAVFSMQEGEISDIVETRYGYHIIKLEEIKPARVRSLDEVRAEIEARLKQERARAVAEAAGRQAYEEIIKAGSLAKYMEEGGAVFQETGFFERSAPPAGVPADPAFVAAAFSLNKGELSSLVSLADGYAILFVEDIKPPAVPPLEEVREQVERDYIAAKAKEMAEEKAAAMLAAVRDGKEFAAAAEEFGVTVQESQPFSRAARFSAGLPLAVVEKGLSLSAAEPLADDVVTEGTAAYVVQFAGTEPIDEGEFAKRRDQYEKQIREENTNALLSAWIATLKARAEITRNSKLL